MSLGKRLTQLRKKRNLTQGELANVLKVSRGAVSMWEIDQRTPDPLILQRIADYFGVSVDYLLGRSTPNQPRSLQEKVFDPTYEPTEVDLEDFLKVANIRFHGDIIATEDKEKLLRIAEILWEERRKDEIEKRK